MVRFLSSNIYYIDDMLRAEWGYGWNTSGRPFATWLYQLLFLSRFIIDFSPLSQVIALASIAFSAYLLSIRLLSEGRGVLLRTAFIVLIALNPYLLQICLSCFRQLRSMPLD